MSRLRRQLYRGARVLGDVEAVAKPRRIPRRVANKILGRTIVRRIWR